MIVNPTPADLAEAELARHLRAFGMSRLVAMARAEAHGDRLAVDSHGTITARLADGSRLVGDAGVEALAREITHDGRPPTSKEPNE